MLKKKINYVDFDGKPGVMEAHFNLTETELVTLESSYDFGLEETIKRIAREQNQARLIEEFKRIIQMAYGVRSGEYFEKEAEHFRRFKAHPAYDALFMQLATDANAAADFMQGIIPEKHRTERDQDKPLMPPTPPTTV